MISSPFQFHRTIKWSVIQRNKCRVVVIPTGNTGLDNGGIKPSVQESGACLSVPSTTIELLLGRTTLLVNAHFTIHIRPLNFFIFWVCNFIQRKMKYSTTCSQAVCWYQAPCSWSTVFSMSSKTFDIYLSQELSGHNEYLVLLTSTNSPD
jgi:hypothetical protein